MTVHHNDVYDNTDGIGLYTTENSEIGWNFSHDNVAYDGLFADTDAINNLIEHNKLTGNNEFDCDDVSSGAVQRARRWSRTAGYRISARPRTGPDSASTRRPDSTGRGASAPPPLLHPHGSRSSRATQSAATTAMIASFARHHWQIASMRASCAHSR